MSSSQGMENTLPEFCVRTGHELRQRDRQETAFTGWLRPLVLAFFGKAMERGFLDCGLGLKKAAESGSREAADHEKENS